jgi:hypothetical protein
MLNMMLNEHHWSPTMMLKSPMMLIDEQHMRIILLFIYYR